MRNRYASVFLSPSKVVLARRERERLENEIVLCGEAFAKLLFGSRRFRRRLEIVAKKFRGRFHAKRVTSLAESEMARRARRSRRGEDGKPRRDESFFRSSRGDRRQKRIKRERERGKREGRPRCSAVWPFFPLAKKKSGEKWKQRRIAQTPSEPGCNTVDILKYLLSAAVLSLSLSLSLSGLTLSRLTLASSVSSRRISLALPFAFNHGRILSYSRWVVFTFFGSAVRFNVVLAFSTGGFSLGSLSVESIFKSISRENSRFSISISVARQRPKPRLCRSAVVLLVFAFIFGSALRTIVLRRVFAVVLLPATVCAVCVQSRSRAPVTLSSRLGV